MLDAIFGLLRIVIGFILVLFLPGYLITGVLYPGREDLTTMERLSYSFVLSIASVLISVLILDIVLGVEITPLTIIVTILFVCAFAATLWNLELLLQKRKKSTDYPSVFERYHISKYIEDLTDNVRRRIKGMRRKGG